MKRFVGILLGLVTLSPFIAIAFWIYVKFQTTPSLIVTLLVLMTGVILAYFVYTKRVKNLDLNAERVDSAFFPQREQNLLWVKPASFCEKFEKTTGTLFIIEQETPIQDLTLVAAQYNKLTDEIHLRFTQGVRLDLKGVVFVGVGNHQFVIDQLKEMVFTTQKQKKKYHFIGNKTFILQGQKEVEKRSNKGAKVVFSFGEAQ